MLRHLLYSVLTFKQYLKVISWGYFVSFELGLLKNDPYYRFTYLLRNVVEKKDVIVDIGANLGYFTRLFAKWVGDAGFVYAIEPIKPILEVLEKNVKGFKNVEILPYAL
ncbi:MAG: FkbM family methyltransferase, partial [Rhodothermia bacterium]